MLYLGTRDTQEIIVILPICLLHVYLSSNLIECRNGVWIETMVQLNTDPEKSHADTRRTWQADSRLGGPSCCDATTTPPQKRFLFDQEYNEFIILLY